MLSALAAAIGRTARVALRVNPDVDAGTHAKITTGRARGQVRHPLWRCRARCIAAPPALPGIAAGRTGDAYRQPDPVAGAVSRRVRTRLPSWSARCAPTAHAGGA